MAARETVIRNACVCSKDERRELSHERGDLLKGQLQDTSPCGPFVRMGLKEGN
jgi:hypothetical protein